MEFSKILLEFRAKHKLTQKQVADIIGVSVVMICRYEKGLNKPTQVNKIRFAKKMKEWEEKKNV